MWPATGGLPVSLTRRWIATFGLSSQHGRLQEALGNGLRCSSVFPVVVWQLYLPNGHPLATSGRGAPLAFLPAKRWAWASRRTNAMAGKGSVSRSSACQQRHKRQLGKTSGLPQLKPSSTLWSADGKTILVRKTVWVWPLGTVSSAWQMQSSPELSFNQREDREPCSKA